MRPDAIPARPLASRATLTPGDARALFGDPNLKGRETVEVVRLGRMLATVPVEVGAETVLRADHTLEAAEAVRLAGPLGAVAASVRRVRSRLLAPQALRRAWGLGETATVVLGSVALAVRVDDGELALEVERALWLGAGRPETARWVSGLAIPAEPHAQTDRQPDGPREILRRVVTETDVRQAILKRQTLRLRDGQIVTPAARSLAREHGVFGD